MVLALCFGAAQSVDAKKKKTRKRVPKTEKKQTVKQLEEDEDIRCVGNDDVSVAKPDENFVTEILAPLETAEEKKLEPKPEPKPQKDEVYKSATQMPQFPGGDAALMTFVSKNIRYPQVAQDNGIQGKVIVMFIVEKDGSVGEVKVARGCDKDLDKEAVRVCKNLPKFKPGRNANGDPVRVWYTFPVTFKLNKSE